MRMLNYLRLFSASRELKRMLDVSAPSSGEKEKELDEKFAADLMDIATNQGRRTAFRQELWRQRQELQQMIDSEIRT